MNKHSKPRSQAFANLTFALRYLCRISYCKRRMCKAWEWGQRGPGVRLCRTVLKYQPSPSPTVIQSTVLLNCSKRCTIFKGPSNTPCSRVSRTSQHITWLSKAAAEEEMFINKNYWARIFCRNKQPQWALGSILGNCQCFTFHLITLCLGTKSGLLIRLKS